MNGVVTSPKGAGLLVRIPLRWIVAVAVCLLTVGCDDPFQPFEVNGETIFSMFGYLDVNADTQWIRIMPVRHNVLAEPVPIDATVTLEHLGSGRVVTLRDSLFRFPDWRLDADAYAYNFWTTERLDLGGRYRITAARSDGASTHAVVVIPHDAEISFLNDSRVAPDFGQLYVRGDHAVFAEVLHWVRLDSVVQRTLQVRQDRKLPTSDPRLHGFGVEGFPLRGIAPLMDAGRQEIRVAVANAEWPYFPDVSDIEISVPGGVPSNVRNGVGFVGGIAAWRIPFHRCEESQPGRDRDRQCGVTYNAQSASLSGRVLRQPCGKPHLLADIRLTERFSDGGSIVRRWRTGGEGEYRFDGVEPGAELVLDAGPGTSPVIVPPLAPGQRYVVPDIAARIGC